MTTPSFAILAAAQTFGRFCRMVERLPSGRLWRPLHAGRIPTLRHVSLCGEPNSAPLRKRDLKALTRSATRPRQPLRATVMLMSSRVEAAR